MLIRDTNCRRCGQSIIVSSGLFSNRMPDNICKDCKKKQEAQVRIVKVLVVLALVSVLPYCLARYVHWLAGCVIPLLITAIFAIRIKYGIEDSLIALVRKVKEDNQFRRDVLLACTALLTSIISCIIGFLHRK